MKEKAFISICNLIILQCPKEWTPLGTKLRTSPECTVHLRVKQWGIWKEAVLYFIQVTQLWQVSKSWFSKWYQGIHQQNLWRLLHCTMYTDQGKNPGAKRSCIPWLYGRRRKGLLYNSSKLFLFLWVPIRYSKHVI